MIRKNVNRFDYFSPNKKAAEIEKHIDKSIRKFHRSNVEKTKVQALFEEIEGYYARNKEFKDNISSFEVYVQHWTTAHRGVIDDVYLDKIEEEYGQLSGPLYIPRGHSSWNTREDHRNDPIPQRGNNE